MDGGTELGMRANATRKIDINIFVYTMILYNTLSFTHTGLNSFQWQDKNYKKKKKNKQKPKRLAHTFTQKRHSKYTFI